MVTSGGERALCFRQMLAAVFPQGSGGERHRLHAGHGCALEIDWGRLAQPVLQLRPLRPSLQTMNTLLLLIIPNFKLLR